MKLTNSKNIPLSLALWLGWDTYAHSDNPHQISVTTLIKPLKQIIMGQRAGEGMSESTQDVSSMIASAMGTSLHNGIEAAWCSEQAPEILRSLGYPKRVVERMVINPEDGEDLTDKIPVYTERRTNKQVGKWTISGEFDFCAEGTVRDFKSTGTYTYTHKTNDDKYALQGSMYRWLNPEIITSDRMYIDFIFTDWSALSARTQSGYPESRVMEYPLTLRSVEETDAYIKHKLSMLEELATAEEELIPSCTKEDLWASDPVYKYYNAKAAVTMKRATKNYKTMHEAEAHRVRDGSMGVVIMQRPVVKACRYCPGLSVCKQGQGYLNDGSLKLE